MRKLNIHTKLYGREQEQKELLNSFKSISSGKGEIVFVPGVPGIGKTVLIEDLKEPVLNANGIFLNGKFEQYQLHTPLFAFRQLVLHLYNYVYSLSESEQQNIKNELLNRLGNLGRVLTNLVPEFETLVGKLPKLQEISPQEASHRFSRVISELLKLFCKPETPLVLFIDDWQWADSTSLRLLENLDIGSSLNYILLIVSYRENEVHHGHPFNSVLSRIKSKSIKTRTLMLKPLSELNVNHLLSDNLDTTIPSLKELSKHITKITGGNPFFVISLTKYLIQNSLIRYDSKNDLWIGEFSDNIPKTITEIYRKHLLGLNKEVLDICIKAACIGSRFSLKTLNIFNKDNSYSTKEILNNTLKEYIIAISDELYQFKHDTIQQAAYSLIKPEELSRISHDISREVLNALPQGEVEEKIFEIIGNLNNGLPVVTRLDEKLTILGLNVVAAKKAYNATAFNAALEYYRVARRILESVDNLKVSKNLREKALVIYRELAKCEFIENNITEAEEAIELALKNCNTIMDEADVYNVLIVQYTLLAKYSEAIKIAKSILEKLGFSLPDDNYEDYSNTEINSVLNKVETKSVQQLSELPVMTDPKILMVTKLLITMGPPCYRFHQKLWSVLVPKVVNLVLEYGNIPQVGYSHTAFGGLVGWSRLNFQYADYFSEIAVKVMGTQFESPSDQSVFYLMIGSSCRHWTKHMKYCSDDYLKAFEIGSRSGNLQYAAYGFGHNMYCSFFQGIDLNTLIKETESSLEFSNQRHNQWAIDLLEGGLNLFSFLYKVDSETILEDKNYLKRIKNNKNIQVECIYKVIKIYICLVLNKYEEAVDLIDQVDKIIYTVGTQGLLPWPEFEFAKALVFISYLGYSKFNDDNPDLVDKLELYATTQPDNFRHKYLLVKAESERYNKKYNSAVECYEEAIDIANRGGFIQWVALGCENYHKFWQELGEEKLSFLFWQRAYNSYSGWKARLKTTEMELQLADSITFNKVNIESKLEVKKHVIQNQIHYLHTLSEDINQQKLKDEALKQTEELADASEKLRIEVAKHKKTTEELFETKEYLENLIKYANAPIMVYNNDLNITRFNKAFEKLTGYGIDEVENKNIELLFPKNERELILNKLNEISTEKGSETIQLTLLTKKGVTRYILWNSANIYSQDGLEVKSTIAQATDITERIIAEKALLENEKLNAIRQTVSIISHEFNNSLQSIMGNIDVLMYSDELSKFAYNKLNSATKALDNLAEKVKLLQNLDKDAKRQQYEKSTVNLNELVQEVITQSSILWKDRYVNKKYGVNIKTQIEENLSILANESEIKAVFYNILKNSYESMPEGGNIDIITKLNGNNVSVQITDSGSGMDKDTISSAFLPFFTKKGFDSGKGIGLSNAKQIMERHSGSISIAHSEPGIGTTMNLEFPVIGFREQAVEQVVEHQLDKKTILWVDDDESIRSLAAELMEVLDYNAIIVSSAEHALEILKDKHVDLIISDIGMPGINGWQFVEKVKQNFTTKYKILFLSGWDAEIDSENLKYYGINQVLVKPVQLADLDEKIKKLLN